MSAAYIWNSPQAGGKWWRLKYRFDNKEKRLSLGVVAHSHCGYTYSAAYFAVAALSGANTLSFVEVTTGEFIEPGFGIERESGRHRP
jgi:hypothetical protein